MVYLNSLAILLKLFYKFWGVSFHHFPKFGKTFVLREFPYPLLTKDFTKSFLFRFRPIIRYDGHSMKGMGDFLELLGTGSTPITLESGTLADRWHRVSLP